MDLRVIAVAFVALVGVWCVVVLPAVWLSGTMSQEEELARSVPPGGCAQTGQSETGQRSEVGGRKAEEDHEEVMDGR